MSTTKRYPLMLLGFIGIVALLLLFAMPSAAQDDGGSPTPAVAIEPTTSDLPPAPDLSMLPDDADAGANPEESPAPVDLAPEIIVDQAPENMDDNGVNQQLAPDQAATCRSKGVQTARINNTTTTSVSAWPQLRPPGGSLLVGNVYTQSGNFPVWSLIKFNYNAGSLPNKSQICAANIRLDRNGAYNRGNIIPAAFQMAGGWAPGWSFRDISRVPRGAALGGINLGGSTLSIDAKGAAQAWLANPGANHGIVVQTNKINTENVASFRQGGTLELKIQCDFYNPTSWVNELPKYSPANFKVSWGGDDPRDPASTNCTPTGIESYLVQYRTPGRDWGSFADTSSTSKTFKGEVADGDKVDFRVAAVDRAYNVQGYGSRVSTVVDFVPPWVVFNPPLGQYTYAENFDVRWSAKDAFSGPKSCTARYRADSESWNVAAISEVGRPSDKETIYRFGISGANQGKTYQFEILCKDNVGNVMPGPATATTIISLYPDAGMNNVTPNYITATAPIQLGWYGQTPPERRIVAYDVYYRNRSAGQSWQSKSFGANETSAAFPFDGSQLAPGIWEFETTATNDKGQTTKVKGVAEASVIVDPEGKGGMNWLPTIHR